MTKVYIKNMVCNRCVMVVKAELEKMGLQPLHIDLGEVELQHDLKNEELVQLLKTLQLLGFELLDNKQQQQIEKVKTLLIAMVQKVDIPDHFSLSDFVSKAMHKEYGTVSRLFSEVEGITLEQFYILQKIEKAKELMLYGEMNASEIAYSLGYSSVAHLSAQFKKVTGLSPSAFKKIGGSRKPLDKL